MASATDAMGNMPAGPDTCQGEKRDRQHPPRAWDYHHIASGFGGVDACSTPRAVHPHQSRPKSLAMW